MPGQERRVGPAEEPGAEPAASGLLLSVERLPAARDRDAARGRLTDNDGNDR
jgi:hypothetical protein